jgi:hypothetical protein
MRYSVGFTKFFDEKEILLAGEFWDFLSGHSQTMQEILDIINQIATPNFREELIFLSEPQNVQKDKTAYLSLLEKWFLFQEQQLVKQSEKIIGKLGNKKMENLYYQSCFRNGEYKLDRVKELLTLL